jgi:hypothetical protein
VAAAVLHPGVVETVVQTTKAAKQSHSAAASVWVMLRGPGCGGGEEEEEEGRSGQTLTHLTTDETVGAMGHAITGGRTGFEVRSLSSRFGGLLLLSMGSKQSREGWSCGGRSVAQVCLFHSASVGERRSVEDAALVSLAAQWLGWSEGLVRRVGKVLGVGCRVDGRRYMAGDVQGWDGPRDWRVE